MSDLVYDFARDEIVPFMPAGAKTALDVGCGGGGFGRSLLRAHPDLKLWGVEPNPTSAELARRTYEEVICGTYPEVAPSLSTDSYDVIFFNDVLEHMVDPGVALTASVAHLNPGGAVVASIPNVRHLSVWWPLIRRGEWTLEDMGIMDRTHLRWFTESSIRELFEASGWTVSTLEGINRCRWPPVTGDTWKTRSLSAVTRGRSDPFFWMQYVVVASPAL